MNTARSFGPAAVTGFPYPKHWVVSCDLHQITVRYPMTNDDLLTVLGRAVLGFFRRRGILYYFQAVSVKSIVISDVQRTDGFRTPSYRYWTLSDQTTEKSPGDPSDTTKNTVGPNTNSLSDKRTDKLFRDEHGEGINGHGVDRKLEKERGRPVNDSPV